MAYILIGGGAVLSAVLAFVLFALWLEKFTRRGPHEPYRSAGTAMSGWEILTAIAMGLCMAVLMGAACLALPGGRDDR